MCSTRVERIAQVNFADSLGWYENGHGKVFEKMQVH